MWSGGDKRKFKQLPDMIICGLKFGLTWESSSEERSPSPSCVCHLQCKSVCTHTGSEPSRVHRHLLNLKTPFTWPTSSWTHGGKTGLPGRVSGTGTTVLTYLQCAQVKGKAGENGQYSGDGAARWSWTRPSAPGCGDTSKAFASSCSIQGGDHQKGWLRSRYRLGHRPVVLSRRRETARCTVRPTSGLGFVALSTSVAVRDRGHWKGVCGKPVGPSEELMLRSRVLDGKVVASGCASNAGRVSRWGEAEEHHNDPDCPPKSHELANQRSTEETRAWQAKKQIESNERPLGKLHSDWRPEVDWRSRLSEVPRIHSGILRLELGYEAATTSWSRRSRSWWCCSFEILGTKAATHVSGTKRKNLFWFSMAWVDTERKQQNPLSVQWELQWRSLVYSRHSRAHWRRSDCAWAGGSCRFFQ